jgi:hypothetical protein
MLLGTGRQGKQRRRGAAGLLLAAVLGLAGATTGHAVSDPATRLAQRFAPILELRAQRDPRCDPRGEQFVPSAVELVLDRKEIVLRSPDAGHPVVATAFTARWTSTGRARAARGRLGAHPARLRGRRRTAGARPDADLDLPSGGWNAPQVGLLVAARATNPGAGRSRITTAEEG